MKKIILPFFISLIIIISIIFIFFNTSLKITLIEKVQFFVILILVCFGFYVGFDRIKSRKLNEPLEDEYTKKILIKTSSISFYVSLYIWVLILIIKDRFIMDIELWIGSGILSMSFIFMLIFFILKIRGLRNE